MNSTETNTNQTYTLNTIYPVIVDLLSETAGADKAGLTIKSSMNTVQGWDSVVHLAFIGAVEEHFGLRFSTKQMLKLLTVEDMCTAVFLALLVTR